jgi:hypothetical protein
MWIRIQQLKLMRTHVDPDQDPGLDPQPCAESIGTVKEATQAAPPPTFGFKRKYPRH